MPPTLPPHIFSGFFEAPAGAPLTPTGLSKRSEVDSPYITRDEYVESSEAIGSGFSTTSADNFYTSGQMDKAILRASAAINRYCNRWFDVQTIDEVHRGFTVKPFNPRLVTVYTRNSPINSIQSIYIQVLQWFIQVQTNPLMGSYLQVEPDWGVFHIVPLLSSAGSGTGSPIPAQILDKVPLGVLWSTYTFGFGQVITDCQLDYVSGASVASVFQVSKNYRLWAPSQTLNIYVNGAIQSSTVYTVDYPNGIVTFNTPVMSTDIVTADFTTNMTLPEDIKYACILLTTKYLNGGQNPMKFKSMNITGYSVSFGDNDEIMAEVKELLRPYKKNEFIVI
jgi:hypothetical protein